MGKKFIFGLILTLIVMIVLAGCGSNSSTGPTYTPGQSATYIVGSGASAVSFDMHYAPSGSFTSDDQAITNDVNATFPATVTVSSPYWMAKTEVTYELWQKVKTWATGYTFASGHGNKGNDDFGSDQDPVTQITWQEAIIWCNALTEYYYGNSNHCVYYSDAAYTTPIRSYTDSNINNPYIKATATGNTAMANCIAKGFRLPTRDEWELAARYKDGSSWTPGNYASGATADISNSSATGAVAWYSVNSMISGSNHTHPVADSSKTANSLGLYDMSGNVMEICFDLYPNPTLSPAHRIMRGGDYANTAIILRIGRVGHFDPATGSIGANVGFRIVMNH